MDHLNIQMPDPSATAEQMADAELGNGGANAVTNMVDASQDMAKLQRSLVAGGVGEAAAALYLALFKSPAGLFLKTKFLLCFYYGALVAVLLFGVAEAWTGFWVARDPRRRRAIGMTVLCVSVLPLLFVVGAGGSVVLK